MEVTPLNWETTFFNYPCGSLELNYEEDFSRSRLATFPYRLIVIKSKVKQSQLSEYLVDEKVTLTKKVSKVELDSEGTLVTNFELTGPILDLALESGKDSRFNRDLHFKSNEFKTLYTQWIEKSLNKNLADEVYVLGDYLDPKGLVTIKNCGSIAKIGLLAIKSCSQGQGMGRQLINWCEHYCFANGVSELQVPTQRSNLNACNFYEKNGFKIENIEYIYHWWNE